MRATWVCPSRAPGRHAVIQVKGRCDALRRADMHVCMKGSTSDPRGQVGSTHCDGGSREA